MYKLRKNGLKLRCYTRRINMFELKRFIAFIAAGLLLVAAKYYPSPLISGKYGKVIYYDYADCEIVEGSAYCENRLHGRRTNGGSYNKRYARDNSFYRNHRRRKNILLPFAQTSKKRLRARQENKPRRCRARRFRCGGQSAD